MSSPAQPEVPFPPRKELASENGVIGSAPANGGFVGQELDAALQLLAERAQYITGATGAALALSQGEEMVCRASAGSSGPAVGARLQVRSGLSGESITRKQLLRCDNAETDPRVNLETCRQLGIASIVVLPLLERNGDVRGIFELFSDHAYAFEERDLIALERMGELTLTALELAEKRPRAVSTPVNEAEAAEADPVVPQETTRLDLVEPKPADADPPPPVLNRIPSSADSEQALSSTADVPPSPPDRPLVTAQVHSALFQQETVSEPPPASVPEAMRRVQKCTACGFPVSEGRTLCVDCENKRHLQPEHSADPPAEFVPAFLDSSVPRKESWLADHVNILAVLVLVLSIVVAIVVFR